MIFCSRFGGGGYIRAGAIFELGLYSGFYSIASAKIDDLWDDAYSLPFTCPGCRQLIVASIVNSNKRVVIHDHV